mgnify:CR=1 FL=1
MTDYTIHRGDCLATMRTMPDNSVDSIVTDPPYELGFMGKSWDASGIAYNVEMWREALRVLKPGGHLLAFSGSRTYHRMACAIEDAGFEIRDQIMWVYGSGFPKSLDVSKAIDKAAGAVREVVGFDAAKAAQQTAKKGTEAYGDFAGSSGDITIPATDAARQWEGWGTALKPAHEPICVARKPLVGTVAANVLAHGTGALNIDGCRVPAEKATGWGGGGSALYEGGLSRDGGEARLQHVGRWPANLIHDGSDEVLALFPESSTTGARTAKSKAATVEGTTWLADNHQSTEYTDSGSAARFFYCAKASKADRGEGNTHPTVKPTNLMAYLCRLVTPPGGVILDPFTGSGSTGKAAVREGFRFIGCELSDEYAAIAEARMDEELYGDIL